jgi:general secretion pathway protein D
LFRSESRTKTRTNLMVFLRPIVMRGPEDANKLTLDRYDLIRAQQKRSTPESNILLPVGDVPVLPPQRAPDAAPSPAVLPLAPEDQARPASAPASAPEAATKTN